MSPTDKHYQIRLARAGDIPGIMRMRWSAIDALAHRSYNKAQLTGWRDSSLTDKYQTFVQQRCLWVVTDQQRILASSGLRLHSRELVAMFVDPGLSGSGLSKRLIAHTERQATRFGILDLYCESSLNAVNFYRRAGYKVLEHRDTCDRLGIPCKAMQKSLRRRQTGYQKKVLNILQQLGISTEYGIQRVLPMQTPGRAICYSGQDCFDRKLQLTPATSRAWTRLCRAAAADDITLQAVSGFRDFDYQVGIVQRKLAAGHSIDKILKVSAAPGFSEHHSGRALDITTPGATPLEESFADTAAYQWLQQHAGQFGFRESYPPDNVHEIAWEPWHWYYFL